MPFQKIEPERLSQTVIAQVESLILQGVLRPGERIPSERDLSERLGVSRPSLRDAIADLEKRDLLVTRKGYGVFVADVLGSAFSEPLIQLFSRHDQALCDYITFRRDLEGLAAARAAKFGTDSDLKVISAVFTKMEAAHQKPNPKDEAALDADFHMAIIEASHNVIMLHMMRSMFSMLQAGVFYNRQIMFKVRAKRETLLHQHKAIHDAILARNPKVAQTAVEAHLTFVETSLRKDRDAHHYEETARLRLASTHTR